MNTAAYNGRVDNLHLLIECGADISALALATTPGCTSHVPEYTWRCTVQAASLLQ
jgi:hypothetical protein